MARDGRGFRRNSLESAIGTRFAEKHGMATTLPQTPFTSSVPQQLVEFLLRPESYGHPPSVDVQFVETHISMVFLVAGDVYKLKKPVCFDFLDFSTLAKRKRMCQSEVELNRRLAPNVYLGVVALTRDQNGQLSIAAEQGGAVIEWLVHMRRLDPCKTLLSALLEQPHDTESPHLERAANYLADFYADQLPVTIKTETFREQLRSHIEDNQRQLMAIAWSDEMRRRITRVHTAQLRYLAIHEAKFDNRVLDGRIVDGHGDLRPDHIYLYDPPLVIDCIEFNEEYRTNDVIDELAFLAMCCDRLGDRLFGLRLFAAYEQRSGDRCDLALISFYKSYRACVRAKVAGLRLAQHHDRGPIFHEFAQFLDLADAHARELDPPLLLMVGGLMGVGKSTLARALQSRLAAHVIASDQIRSASVPATDSQPPTDYDTGRYQRDARLDVYREMMRLCESALKQTDAILLDATFSTHDARRMAFALGKRHKLRIIQIECICPRDTAVGRIEDRLRHHRSPSEARPEHFDRFAADAESPLVDHPVIRVDTREPIAMQCATVLSALEQLLTGS